MAGLLSERNRSLLRFLGRRVRFHSLLTFFSGLLGGVVDYGFAIVIQLFLASVGLTAAFSPKWSHLLDPITVGAILIAIGIARAAFVVLQGFAAGVAQEATASRVRTAAIMRILPYDEKSRAAAGEALFIYSDLSSRSAIFLVNFLKLVAGVLQTIVLGLAMLYISWRDCLVGGAALMLAGVILLRINVRVGLVAKLIPTIWNESIAAIEGASRNWLYIRIKHLHAREREHLCAHNRDVQAIGIRLRWLGELNPAAVNVSAVVILAVLTLTRARMTHTSAMVFIAFLYVFLRFAQALGDSARSGSAVIEHWPYFQRLGDLAVRTATADVDMAAAVDAEVSVLGKARPRPMLPPASAASERPASLRSPRIVMRSVSFRYDADAPFVLRDLDLDVAAGTQFAIVGPSGCGKTTLLALLLGLHRPTDGAIEIDGVSAERYCADGAEYIGYVGPEPFMITGTVRENVLFGSNAVYGDDEVWRALEQAALAAHVRSLPAQLDTVLRHHDVALSMGQRQRLALARALLPRPALLVLDEASSNLDDATEDSIATTIRALKGATTTIIVSHKLGLVKFADHVLDLGALRRELSSAGSIT